MNNEITGKVHHHTGEKHSSRGFPLPTILGIKRKTIPTVVLCRVQRLMPVDMVQISMNPTVLFHAKSESRQGKT